MSKDELKTRLNKVKQVLDHNPPKENAMPAEKKIVKAAPVENVDPADDAPKPKKAKKVEAPKDSDDANLVRLADLVREAKTTGQAARRKLRAKEFARSGRWAWPADSADLKAVREVLGLPN